MKKSKESKGYTNDKIQCYKCKGFGHVMHECPTKDNDQDLMGKRVLQATMKPDDEGSDDCLSEFCFLAMEDGREKDFEWAFEELYVESIYIAKKNKKLIEQIEAINKEKEALKKKLKCKGLGLKHSKAREEVL